MTLVLKLLKHQVLDQGRSRWVVGYLGLILVLTEALVRFGGGGPRAVVSLLNLVLMFVPLASLVFGAMHVYAGREFIELLLAQPIRRRTLFLGLFGGLTLPLAAALVLGLGLPFLWRGNGDAPVGGALATLVFTGVLLTMAFGAIAFWIALRFDDRAKGLAVAIFVWLAATALYDAFLVLVVTVFADYPLERPLLGLVLLNPVDLGRILVLLQTDAAALMGYTGAVFERFFGSVVGLAVAGAALVVWTLVPFGLGLSRFQAKDF